MRAALDGVDVVHKGVHLLGVGIVVLEREFNYGGIFCLGYVDRIWVKCFPVGVQEPHKFADAAFVVEGMFLVLFRIDNGNMRTGV